MQLYGFRTLAEREWHRLLMTVQGVGAKAALAILGALGTEGVARALSLGDAAAIRAAPGVGPKIAQRVMLELKAKAPAVIAMGAHGAAPVTGVGGGVGGGGAAAAPPAGAGGDAQAQADALSALVNLGYGAGRGGGGDRRGRGGGRGRADPRRRCARWRRRGRAWPVPIPRCRPETLPEDADRALRPQTLDEFVGQKAARANLAVFIESARRRGEAMDHTLFYGPPGLGKTTLAQIMARELGVNFRMTSGPVLAQGGGSGGDPDQPRRARRALHRRDPPAEPGGGGDPLSGARGLPARPRHRRGAGGADGAARAAALHAGRGDDAARAADDAACATGSASRRGSSSTTWTSSCRS